MEGNPWALVLLIKILLSSNWIFVLRVSLFCLNVFSGNFEHWFFQSMIKMKFTFLVSSLTKFASWQCIAIFIRKKEHLSTIEFDAVSYISLQKGSWI